MYKMAWGTRRFLLVVHWTIVLMMKARYSSERTDISPLLVCYSLFLCQFPGILHTLCTPTLHILARIHMYISESIVYISSGIAIGVTNQKKKPCQTPKRKVDASPLPFTYIVFSHLWYSWF